MPDRTKPDTATPFRDPGLRLAAGAALKRKHPAKLKAESRKVRK